MKVLNSFSQLWCSAYSFTCTAVIKFRQTMWLRYSQFRRIAYHSQATEMFFQIVAGSEVLSTCCSNPSLLRRPRQTLLGTICLFMVRTHILLRHNLPNTVVQLSFQLIVSNALSQGVVSPLRPLVV